MNMNVNQMIKEANNAYINYRSRCESLAKEAQKYIDWDDKSQFVSICQQMVYVSWQPFPTIVMRVKCQNVFAR